MTNDKQPSMARRGTKAGARVKRQPLVDRRGEPVRAERVRKLYLEEHLTPGQIADRLGILNEQARALLRRLKLGDVCFCGVKIKDHAQCAGCGILVGPGHITEKVSEKGYCITCQRIYPKKGGQQ